MRFSNHNAVMKGRAFAGTYVVVLAWDFQAGHEAKLEGLLGFGIERSEIKDGAVVERYWMRGMKRFRDKDRGLAPGTPVSTAEHPVQSLQWADYTAEQDRKYEYRIVPLYGAIKNIKPDDGSSLTLEVETEVEYLLKPNVDNDKAKHDVYFNRGVIGSQAFARRFENARPDLDNPTSPEMRWLSRGLFEALLKFIGLAEDDRYSLRAAVYEFHYQPVANAFMKAIQAGADVKIVYDAESGYKKENEAVIDRAGLRQAGAVIPRTVTEGIRHNKFIVLSKDDIPMAVWTGSTNISDGGIFGHSNVGHVVWDSSVARAYADYWDRLKQNLTPTKLRAPNRKASPLPVGKPDPNTVIPVFSSRDEPDSSASLQWYADRMADAEQIVCFTVAFNIDKVFQEVLQRENDVLRYVVKDDDLQSNEIITRDRDVLFAAGGYLEEGALTNFLKERDNPLNSNDYIHDKFLLVDPLSDDPLVVTGSANFSQPSQRTNDENMLAIRGDTRVADIYFGEFMRIFDHHYARYLVKKLTESGKHDPDAGYLKENPEEWTRSHFDEHSYKSKRRRYFVG